MNFLLGASGCISIPWWERHASYGDTTVVDFRPLIGPAGSDKPLRVGEATRWGVADMLGQPPLLSVDGSFGYTYDTVTGMRIFLPLFFLPRAADAHAYVLRADFGDDGRLKAYSIFRKDREINADLFGYTGLPSSAAVAAYNETTDRKLWYPCNLATRIQPATQPTR